MKAYKILLLIAQIMLISLVLGGCSSGSSSGSSSTKLLNLTPEKANQLAVSAASALPGCEYTSDTAIGGSPAVQSVGIIYKNALSKTIEDEHNTVSAQRAIDDKIDGNCPTNPGYYTKIGTHENSVENLTYNFVGYCVGDENESTTITGKTYPKSVSTPTDNGPIFQYLQVASGNVTVVEKSLDGTYTHTISGKKVKYVNGNGGDANATESNPNKLVIDLFSIKDGRTGNTYSIKNADVSAYPSDDNVTSVTIIKNLTYTDSATGSVTIKTGSPLVTDADGVITSGAIIVTGEDGTSMTMVPDPSVTNGFSVKVGEDLVGVMDCSGLAD